MRRVVIIFLFLCFLLSNTLAKGDGVVIEIANPLDAERLTEMVELDKVMVVKKLGVSKSDTVSAKSIVITDALGNEIPSQSTYDGKLIFQVSGLKAKEKRTYYAKVAKSSGYKSKVFGRQYPERQQDFSFENDRIGYRLYGPETQTKGEKLYGYDIFNKRTDELILDELYANQTDPDMWKTFYRLNKGGMKKKATALYMAYCYHIDHGKGMDCYKVGPTLGAGTNALMFFSSDDEQQNYKESAEKNHTVEIFYPWCYIDYEVLDNGPLRLTVMLNYGTRKINGVEISEERILTVDAGSNLVKSKVSYSVVIGNSFPDNLKACCGIVVHDENPEAFLLDQKNGTMAYEDLGDVTTAWEGFRQQQAEAMGKIFIGTFVPSKEVRVEMLADEEIKGAKGHLLSYIDLPKTKETSLRNFDFVYYFGSAWDRNPNTSFKNLDLWMKYLNDFSSQYQKPLVVKM